MNTKLLRFNVTFDVLGLYLSPYQVFSICPILFFLLLSFFFCFRFYVPLKYFILFILINIYCLIVFHVRLNHYYTFKSTYLRFHVWMRTYSFCLFVWIISLSIMPSSSILLKMIEFHCFVWLNNIALCICMHFLYTLICWWAPTLIPYLNHYE